MTYAARYPAQVAGLVLLDSVSPRQFTVAGDFAAQYPMLRRLYGIAPTLARLGVGQLVPALSASRLPGDAAGQAGAFAVSPRTWRTTRDEHSVYWRAFEQAQALTTFGNKPLAVVSASQRPCAARRAGRRRRPGSPRCRPTAAPASWTALMPACSTTSALPPAPPRR